MLSRAVQRGTVLGSQSLSADARTLDYLKQIYEAGTALAEIDNIGHLLERVAKIAVVMGHCEGCSILSSNGRSLEFLASLNVGMEGDAGALQYFSNIVIPINNSTIVGHCAATKKTLSIDDVYKIPDTAGYSYNSKWDEENNYRCESILSIPMLDSKQNVLGVLELINHISGEEIAPFPTEMEEYLRVLANQVGIVLKNLQQAEELRRSRYETVMQFVKACEYRDHGHAWAYRKNWRVQRCDLRKAGLHRRGMQYHSSCSHVA